MLPSVWCAFYDNNFGAILRGISDAFSMCCQGVATGKLLNFLFPLVFQRCGAYHKHTVSHTFSQIDFGSGNCLDGFSKSHFVGNDGLSGFDGKTYAFPLIGIQCHFEQAVKGFVCILLFDELLANDFLAFFEDKVQRVIIAPEVFVNGLGCLQKDVELSIGILTYHTVFVEVVFGQSFQHFCVVFAKAYLDASLAFVVYVYGTVCRCILVNLLPFLLYPQFDGLKMFARSQLSGLEVEA